jgi:hypothetical protein
MNFEQYLRDSEKDSLINDLRELFASQQGVRSYFTAKLGSNELLLEEYRERLMAAIYPDEMMNGGMDGRKVDSILQELRTPTTTRQFVEVSLIGVEECSKIANDFGGADEDFLVYFEDLFEEVLHLIKVNQWKSKYDMRLRQIIETAFEGYGHHDQLSDLYSIHFDG